MVSRQGLAISFLLSLAFEVFSQSCEAPAAEPVGFAKTTFDYLIVGGGTAGLAIASRLAEDPKLEVGVIEAGVLHQNDPLIDVPSNQGLSAGNSNYDWNFVTVPLPGANQRSIAATRGKILGGSSALNFFAWTRASSPEYDSWDAFAPGRGWNWKGLHPFLDKAASIFPGQTNTFPGVDNSTTTKHGSQGPIQTSINEVYPDPVFPFVKALNARGIRTNPDPDNGNTTGVSNSRVSVDRTLGARSYSATGYYCRSASRKNFHVLTGAQATKVLFETQKSGLKATGVKFSSNSELFTARARKEVILSAGVYQSPQLLELSGIGNKNILTQVGIPTLIDLPGVGENLQDHLSVAVQYQLIPGFLTFDALRNNATFAAEQADLYNRTRSGLLAATNSALGFFPLPSFLSDKGAQSLLRTFNEATIRSHPSPLQVRQYEIQSKWLQQGIVPQIEMILFSGGAVNLAPNASYITVLASGMHPVGRGSVHINSSLPLTPPVINSRWLENDFDTALLLQGLKFSLQLGATEPLASIIQSVSTPPLNATDDELISYIRQSVVSSQHPLGTAPMAPRNLGGVVDSQLKVYGTSNLRICDASIIPLTIGTHPQSTVYAIAEKLATMIRD